MNSMQPDFMGESPFLQEHKKIKKDGNFVGGLLVLLLCTQILVSAGLLMAAFFNGWDLKAEDYGLGNTGFVLLNMLVYVLFLVVPTAVVALCSRRRAVAFPAKKVSGGLFAVCVLGGMALAILSNVVTGWLIAMMESVGIPLPQFPETVEKTAVSLLLNIISTALIPAFVEEWIFRGFVFGTLRTHGDSVAVVFSAALFGLFHGNLVQIPFAFLLGLVLAYLVVLTDSIWPSVVLHGANNLMSVLLSFVGLYVSAEKANTVTLTVFLTVAAFGVAALLPALLHHKQVIKPIGNGLSLFTPKERAAKLLTAPLLLIAVVGMVILTGVSL